MRKLLLIRHAKSISTFDEVDDHERPLSHRGEEDAVTMARYLADKDESLDVVYSSTATRALDFAQLISEFLGTSLLPDLTFYTFNHDELLEILRSLPDSAQRVAVVVHNPAVTHVVNKLTGVELANVPTAGIAAINCNVDVWREIGNVDGECIMDYFITPKILRLV